MASSQPYTDRKVSFCAWLLVPEQPELLIVEDMMADSRCTIQVCAVVHLIACIPYENRAAFILTLHSTAFLMLHSRKGCLGEE